MALSGTGASDVEGYIGSVPVTLVERYLWLKRQQMERINDAFDTCGDLWRLVNFLLCDIEESEHTAAPHPVAHRLFELAVDRPELLEFITLRIRDMPVVLADMLLEPQLSALACMLAVGWSSGGGAWERELRDRDDHSARVTAFTDAFAVVVYYAERKLLPPAELAALLSWLHGEANARSSLGQHQPKVDDRMLNAVRSALLQLSPELLCAVVESCMASERPTHVGSPSFVAALDVMRLGVLSDIVEPETLIAPYLSSIRSGTYSLSAASIETPGAAALVRLAQRAADARWREFLAPLDLRALLAKGNEPGANKFIVRADIARSIRTHVRILCRAIVSWDDTPPPELVNGLLESVRSGAVSHEEKGRVAAFAAQHEADPEWDTRNERSIAADLAEALVALTDPDRDRLLAAILETDEPLMLAQLLVAAPHPTRERIRERINALTPTEAGELSSLTHVHARIEALLEAGAVDAAASFIAAEREIRTFGKVPGRELAQLRMTMRLCLLRQDFPGIAKAEVPPGLSQNEALEAQGVLDFYKSLAEFSKPDGNLSAAEGGFQRLQATRPEVPAYATNLLAVRASKLLSGNLFGRLGGKEAAAARQVLAEADGGMGRWIGANEEDLAIFNGNRALLLLAIGQPERAHELLEGTPASKRQERIAAYSAVALARMGRSVDASEALRAAESLFGDADLLRAARAQIQRGVPLNERATAVVADDPAERIKAALFELLQMDPIRQAEILHGAPGGSDGMVMTHVRSAAATVMSLVPMMKVVQVGAKEDDLTALIQAILAARLEFFGWSLADQSKGGFTSKGNPAERDLVLRKGNIVVSAIEAVVCDRPTTHQWTKGELTSHFQKLLGYSTCRLFFHLTYSYVADPDKVLAELHRIAREECPSGFSLTRLEELPRTDSTPPGFWATYDSALGEVKVVFLLLDMGQNAQRDAARAAAESNPRQKRDYSVKDEPLPKEPPGGEGGEF
jgi:hypothetical protein